MKPFRAPARFGNEKPAICDKMAEGLRPVGAIIVDNDNAHRDEAVLALS